MFDGLSPELLNQAPWLVIALLVITRQLVWKGDLREVKKERDEWKGIALRALGVAERTTGHAAKAVEVLTSTDSEVPGVERT